jgi:hypothetical protein
MMMMMMMKNISFYVLQQTISSSSHKNNNDVNKCFIDHPKIAKNQQIAFFSLSIKIGLFQEAMED